MKPIHWQGFVHRALKPENILTDERGFAEIGDLGSSPLFEVGLRLPTQVGTPLYLAPETHDESDQIPAADACSFALIPCELVVGQLVFPPTIGRNVLSRQVSFGERPSPRADIEATV
jgi:serine/threonine protein kinase